MNIDKTCKHPAKKNDEQNILVAILGTQLQYLINFHVGAALIWKLYSKPIKKSKRILFHRDSTRFGTFSWVAFVVSDKYQRSNQFDVFIPI